MCIYPYIYIYIYPSCLKPQVFRRFIYPKKTILQSRDDRQSRVLLSHISRTEILGDWHLLIFCLLQRQFPSAAVAGNCRCSQQPRSASRFLLVFQTSKMYDFNTSHSRYDFNTSRTCTISIHLEHVRDAHDSSYIGGSGGGGNCSSSGSTGVVLRPEVGITS